MKYLELVYKENRMRYMLKICTYENNCDKQKMNLCDFDNECNCKWLWNMNDFEMRCNLNILGK